MREDKGIMLKFVKMVEKYPVIYDLTSEEHRSRLALEKAWEEIANCVRNELKEECTVDELKAKWKGIRSSLARFKNKLYQSNYEEKPWRKYYLYDSLRFLDPFVIPKGIAPQENNESDNHIEDYNFVEVNESRPDDWSYDNKTFLEIEENYSNESKRIKLANKISDNTNTTEDNEDMQFFKSILSDLRKFTSKEKRKFKIKILQLIDEIEDDRKRSDVSDS